MRKRGRQKTFPPIGDPHDPESLYHYQQRFLQWLREHNYSQQTVDNRELYLRYFILWCDERGLTRPPEITKPIIERYQRYLFLYRKANGQPLTAKGQSSRVICLRVWFRWLAKNNYVLYNPASDIELPRQEQRLPQHILSPEEAEQVINQPDVQTPLGIRDRAMLETFYSTGMRRMELINLKVFSLDTERGTVMIRQGKGKKDRMIPIGERAIRWIEKYRDEVRAELTLGQDDGTLFLTQVGEPFGADRLTQLVRNYVKDADIGKKGACHLFRHTMATHMLENGADIRFIQAMLGHADLSATQVYTQVAIKKLKDIHTATHPAKLERKQTPERLAEVEAESLLAALSAEVEEES